MITLNYQDYSLEIPISDGWPDKELLLDTKVLLSMNGTFYSYNNKWSKQRYKITNKTNLITRAKRNEILSFFDIAIGNEFELVDEDLIHWIVRYIGSKSTEIEQNSRYLWKMVFILEGYKNA